MGDGGVQPQFEALAGVRVLVTRPQHQNATLVELIEARGGSALCFPLIDIAEPRDPGPALATIQRLDEFDWMVFVSRNAVDRGLALLAGVGGLPSSARVAAVGAATASALEQAGVESVLRPAAGASSEALLALGEFSPESVAGCRVLIFKGEGGRELLAESLSKRGARVTYAEVYRRIQPRADAGEVIELGLQGGIDVIVITSAESFDNLLVMAGERGEPWLHASAYVVVSERVAQRVQASGVRVPAIVAACAGDEALIDALVEWRNREDRRK